MQADFQEELEIPSQGYLEFTPWQMGDLHLTLIAESRHALYSPRARIEARRTVKVTAPPSWEVLTRPLDDLMALINKPWGKERVG
jgi:hypothetical protein